MNPAFERTHFDPHVLNVSPHRCVYAWSKSRVVEPAALNICRNKMVALGPSDEFLSSMHKLLPASDCSFDHLSIPASLPSCGAGVSVQSLRPNAKPELVWLASDVLLCRVRSVWGVPFLKTWGDKLLVENMRQQTNKKRGSLPPHVIWTIARRVIM